VWLNGRVFEAIGEVTFVHADVTVEEDICAPARAARELLNGESRRG